MSKYYTLSAYLSSSGLDSVSLTLKEIEAILGFPLPKTATGKAFWTNYKKCKNQSKAWLSAGYKTKVNLAQSMINFKKTDNIQLGINDCERPKAFEELARGVMGAYFGVALGPRKRVGWAKLFDLVSDDYRFVGDVTCLSMGGGCVLPPIRGSLISELVWMLEKTGAQKKFLVFGNDRRVPPEWLRRYGHLVGAVDSFSYQKPAKLRGSKDSFSLFAR